MSDRIFNELSIDFDFSDAPISESDAKTLLKDFVDVCLASSLALGTKPFLCLYSNKLVSSPDLSTAILWGHKNSYALLQELIDEGKLSDDEGIRFKQMIAEISTVEIDPEYIYKDKEVFGIGKAVEENGYLVSFTTHADWKLNDVSNIKKISLIPQYQYTSCPDVKNISSMSHIFIDHDITRLCEFEHKKPKKLYFLPNIGQSKYIPEAFSCNDWKDFYTKYRTGKIDRTQCLSVARNVARVNGWKSLGNKNDNQGTPRQTFKAKNHYLQVDTEKGAFEVYNGPSSHRGEILFNSNELKNPVSTRSIYI